MAYLSKTGKAKAVAVRCDFDEGLRSSLYARSLDDASPAVYLAVNLMAQFGGLVSDGVEAHLDQLFSYTSAIDDGHNFAVQKRHDRYWCAGGGHQGLPGGGLLIVQT